MRPMLIPRLAVVVAAVAALGLPAAAAAQPAFYEVEYQVDFDATAHWSIDRTDQNSDGTTKDSWSVEADSHLTGTLENITFRNGQLLNEGVPFAIASQTNTGGGDSKHEHWDPSEKHWV